MNRDIDGFHIEEGYEPYTHLRFKNDSNDFHFALVADNSGSARSPVLPAAIEMVNLLQPEFQAGDRYGRTAGGFDQDPGNFAKIEALLADRPYTVFAAHTHMYDYTERNGREYITTACTGAMNMPRLGAIDHLVWVTVTDRGPKIANLLMNGILDKRGPVRGDALENLGLYRPRT